MKTLYIFIIFIIVAVAQLYIPAQMILDQEQVLETGTAYKFRTQPIDPSDPFRGKYITLNYELDAFATKDSDWKRNDEVFVYLKKDELGFAKIDKLSKHKLESGNDYVIAKVTYYNSYSEILRFNYNFDRFYMNEDKAYDAKVAHREAQRDSSSNTTYAVVYISNGNAVLDNVLINDIPISKFVE
ncbi:hypothetical protein A9Q87_06540 [Flavobacteriales bacterium 34_180_T64]|nr:hypothetical protein A9Q87_06540 [Flavobacteriales bacterium 34_180_T64]